MKIINSHVHMIDIEGMRKKYPDLGVQSGISGLDGIERLVVPLTDPEALIKQMDEAGIERCIAYALEAPMVYASNEYVARLCESYPGRLIGFASVDPKREDALDVLENAISGMGLKGIKFHPPLQNFFANDPSVYHIYEWAEKRNLPIVFHVGTTPFGSICRLSQANPLLLDDVAVEFPRLKIILTHLGTLWQDEAFMVVEKNPCVYIDTAAYLYEIEQLLSGDLIKRLGENKLIFGTDYPMPFGGTQHRMKDFVDSILNLNFSSELKSRIFHENVERLIP